jgi:hypothetical protein
MNFSFAALDPAMSLLFGFLILIFPQFLNYIIAIYLILAGIVGLGLLR